LCYLLRLAIYSECCFLSAHVIYPSQRSAFGLLEFRREFVLFGFSGPLRIANLLVFCFSKVIVEGRRANKGGYKRDAAMERNKRRHVNARAEVPSGGVQK
jgi:hypothetical protein